MKKSMIKLVAALKSIDLPFWMAILGTGCLLWSWKIQNFDLSTSNDEKAMILRDQLVVSNWEQKRDQWNIALLHELATPQASRDFLARAALESNTTAWIWISKLKMVAEPQNRSAIEQEMYNNVAHYQDLLHNHDVESLLQINRDMTAQIDRSHAAVRHDNELIMRIRSVEASINSATRGMSIGYILGTLLILGSTVLSSRQADGALKKLLNKQTPLSHAPDQRRKWIGDN
jgi:hypothetical protein